MAGKKISRNDPCPCGSGKKFKNCCIHKDIDWEARRRAGTRSLLLSAAPQPETAPPAAYAALRPYGVVDARLKEIAKSSSGAGGWKGRVERLSDATPDEERIEVYKAVREAGVLPPDAAFFLFGHAIQWMPPEEAAEDEPDEDDEDKARQELHRHTLAALRRFRLDDLADQYAGDRLGYDRRHERGRQFFFGPPDEGLAEVLREKGIID